MTGTLKRPGFRIEKIIFESTPHHHVTANLYVPAGQGKYPAVLFPCGHEAEGKATVSYQKTAMLFATHGFAVLVPDPVSQGERMQLTDATGKPLTRGGTTEHTLLNAQANLLGRTLAAAELWDNVRGLDYLSTRPDVDTARLGCLGNSGGATQTAYLMAYDKRLKAAALCSYVAAGERNLELTGPADGCVMLPGAGAARLDMGDWLIAFAPKPLLLLAGRYDFVDYTSIETAHAEAQRAYTALGKPEAVGLFAYDDGHGISQPKREEAVMWFRRWFYKDEQPVTEGILPVSTAKELQCTATGQVNTAFKNESNLTAFYQSEACRLADIRQLPSDELVRIRVRNQVRYWSRRYLVAGLRHPQWPSIIETWQDTLHRAGLNFRKLILRREMQPPLAALLVRATGDTTSPSRIVVCISDKGKAALADSAAFLASLLVEHTALLLVDLRGQGEMADPVSFNDPKYYNREYRPAMLGLYVELPLLAWRVTDLRMVFDFLSEEYYPKIIPMELYAIGRSASLVALHEGVISRQIACVRLPKLPLSYEQLLAQPITKDTYSDMLPGVLQHYDVPDLVRALGTRLVMPK